MKLSDLGIFRRVIHDFPVEEKYEIPSTSLLPVSFVQRYTNDSLFYKGIQGSRGETSVDEKVSGINLGSLVIQEIKEDRSLQLPIFDLYHRLLKFELVTSSRVSVTKTYRRDCPIHHLKIRCNFITWERVMNKYFELMPKTKKKKKPVQIHKNHLRGVSPRTLEGSSLIVSTTIPILNLLLFIV